MPTSLSAVMDEMVSTLSRKKIADSADKGEPKSPPASRVHAAVFHNRGFVPTVTLKHAREIHNVTIRLYAKALEDLAEVEDALDLARAAIIEDTFGNFDLGGTVAYICPTGVAQVTWRYGYQTVGTTMFRLCDVEVPFYIDDRSEFAR